MRCTKCRVILWNNKCKKCGAIYPSKVKNIKPGWFPHRIPEHV